MITRERAYAIADKMKAEVDEDGYTHWFEITRCDCEDKVCRGMSVTEVWFRSGRRTIRRADWLDDPKREPYTLIIDNVVKGFKTLAEAKKASRIDKGDGPKADITTFPVIG